MYIRNCAGLKMSNYSAVGASILRCIAEEARIENINSTPGATVVIGKKNISTTIQQAISTQENLVIQIGGCDTTNDFLRIPRHTDITQDFLKKIKALLKLRARCFINKGHLILILLLPRHLISNLAVTREIVKTNRELRKIVREVRKQSKTKIQWVDTEYIAHPSFFRKDQVHPNEKGTKAIAKQVTDLMNNNYA